MGVDQLVTGGDVDNPVVESVRTDDAQINSLSQTPELVDAETEASALTTQRESGTAQLPSSQLTRGGRIKGPIWHPFKGNFSFTNSSPTELSTSESGGAYRWLLSDTPWPANAVPILYGIIAGRNNTAGETTTVEVRYYRANSETTLRTLTIGPGDDNSTNKTYFEVPLPDIQNGTTPQQLDMGSGQIRLYHYVSGGTGTLFLVSKLGLYYEGV